MSCAESLRTQAYFDGELDATSAVAAERHAATCAECQALLQQLEETRQAIRREMPMDGAPQSLRRRMERALREGVTPRRPAPLRGFWAGAGSGAAAALAAVALFALFRLPAPGEALLDTLVSEHLDALLPGHLIEVESSDRHTVKPWFGGHADVSPLVEDFAAQGFPLVGGRAGYVSNQRAAVLVYRHGAHVIDVFAWKGASPNRELTRSGYHIDCWKSRDLQYCAISDAAWDELHRLAALFAAAEVRGEADAPGT